MNSNLTSSCPLGNGLGIGDSLRVQPLAGNVPPPHGFFGSMISTPSSLELTLRPARRPEVLDLRTELRRPEVGERLAGAKRLLVASHHTTAGFLDAGLDRRVAGDERRLEAFIGALGSVFPPEAGYEHDRLHLRDELSEAEKAREPLNADAHLAFIGGGFTNCATLSAELREPVWFVDFDGVYPDREGRPIHRTRKATVVGFRDEEAVTRFSVKIPVPDRPGVVRLDDPGLGLLERLRLTAGVEGIGAGRAEVRLEGHDPAAGLTMNEFEALLMERDLTRVLHDPMGFIRSAAHAVGSAADALGRAFEALHVTPNRLERLVRRIMAKNSPRFLRIQREVTIPLIPQEEEGPGRPLLGTYQSPLLVQRSGSSSGFRSLSVSLTRFR
jgi:thiamine phosphate synthase YjbQ (UPF0047 family)